MARLVASGQWLMDCRGLVGGDQNTDFYSDWEIDVWLQSYPTEQPSILQARLLTTSSVRPRATSRR